MPMFVLSRNYVLTTTAGRSIQFEKGKPTLVPPMMVRDAVAIGATPADGSEVDVLEPDTIDTTPKDPTARSGQIYKAIEQLVANNQRKDFTSAGSPHVKAVTRVLGWEPDPREVALAWGEHQLAKAQAFEQAQLDDSVKE
jgi:hypothetical protein